MFLFQSDILSAAMVQRIHAVFAIPVFLISCFSIFCFFGGQVVGYIFFERLIIEGKYNNWLLLSIFSLPVPYFFAYRQCFFPSKTIPKI